MLEAKGMISIALVRMLCRFYCECEVALKWNWIDIVYGRKADNTCCISLLGNPS